MRAELARGEGDKSPDTQTERSPSESCVYVSPEPRTLANERRPRVRRSVCLLFVLLSTLFVVTLAVSLFALVLAMLFYQNTLAFSSATTPLFPTTTSTPSTTYITSTPHIMTTSTVTTTATILPNTFTNVPTATGPAILIIISSSHGQPVY